MAGTSGSWETPVMTMTKAYVSVLVFGLILGLLTITLQFFEYRYYVGRLNTDIYTAVVATIFTAIGIWLGMSLLKGKKEKNSPEIDLSKVKKLKLNEREYEVLQLIAQGLSNQEIADKLFLALPTIKTHTSNLYWKLNVQSRTQAVHKARSLNLI